MLCNSCIIEKIKEDLDEKNLFLLRIIDMTKSG